MGRRPIATIDAGKTVKEQSTKEAAYASSPKRN
jgi:hypothetical protein